MSNEIVTTFELNSSFQNEMNIAQHSQCIKQRARRLGELRTLEPQFLACHDIEGKRSSRLSNRSVDIQPTAPFLMNNISGFRPFLRQTRLFVSAEQATNPYL